MVTAPALGFLLSSYIGSATADVYLPPPGKLFQGVAGQPISAYEAATGKHPAVYQEFLAWGQYVPAA